MAFTLCYPVTPGYFLWNYLPRKGWDPMENARWDEGAPPSLTSCFSLSACTPHLALLSYLFHSLKSWWQVVIPASSYFLTSSCRSTLMKAPWHHRAGKTTTVSWVKQDVLAPQAPGRPAGVHICWAWRPPSKDWCILEAGSLWNSWAQGFSLGSKASHLEIF